MGLVAALSTIDAAKPGRLKWMAVYTGSLTGLQEPEPGWLLANGASVTNVAPYTALFAQLGSKFGGSGKLPNLVGVSPIPKGASSFVTVGATGGEALHVLTLAELPPHTHNVTILGSSRQFGGSSTGYGYETFSSSGGWDNDAFDVTTSGGDMGGQGHENLPPILVVGAVLVKY